MTILAPPNPSTATDLPAPKRWLLRWRGRTFHESDLTGAHLGVLAILNGADDWHSLDVNPAAGPVRLMLMIGAFLIIEAGSDDPETMARILDEVRKAPAEEILGALDIA